MAMSHRTFAPGNVRALVLFFLGAQAGLSVGAPGMYRCYNGNSMYVSDKPCRAEKREEKFTAMGPSGTPMPIRGQSYNLPSVEKAPEHLRYLSTGCAQLNDAIRTAPTRGLRSDVIHQLRSEYQAKCSDDENEAYRSLRNDRDQARQERRAEQQAHQAQREFSQKERDRCNEMLRILHGKRSQFESMTEGQKNDFVNFQSNYSMRCKND
ncbi:hypothetical protein [Aquabacterium sp.]|uniref:hypothetical protein n=1 Tax=Aquabacterium sp. TaxID=1872578 RepID=UPI002489D47A|nr:hypothetical protein [Aquabacterium sp.]MDI1259138.1 hypothetical protein [Aquabacterium sp.]